MEGPSKPFNTDNALELQRLGLALDSAGIGTWQLDLHTKQVRWCRRSKALFHFSGDDFIELKHLLDLIHPRDSSGFMDKIYMALPFSLELRTTTDQMGQYRWLHCKGQSHLDPGTSSLCSFGTFSDIT